MTKPSETQGADYEREEGEIVDDIDDLSDFSSEEEYLLRERLQVFENYNNVLERKQAKGSHYSGTSTLFIQYQKLLWNPNILCGKSANIGYKYSPNMLGPVCTITFS